MGALVQRICWLILAAIHAVPALAFFRPSSITQLYGVAADDQLFLLLHHRAALFLAIFIACIWAAFHSQARRMAGVLVAISMISFLWLFVSAGQPASLKMIALADLVGLPFLLIAGVTTFRNPA